VNNDVYHPLGDISDLVLLLKKHLKILFSR
jgi:hypothetical protein